MKILFIIIISMFIFSQAYADHHADETSPTKENMCGHANTEIQSAYISYRSSFLRSLDAIKVGDEAEQNREVKIYNEEREKLLIYSTIYKNLDCADIAPLRKLL